MDFCLGYASSDRILVLFSQKWKIFDLIDLHVLHYFYIHNLLAPNLNLFLWTKQFFKRTRQLYDIIELHTCLSKRTIYSLKPKSKKSFHEAGLIIRGYLRFDGDLAEKSSESSHSADWSLCCFESYSCELIEIVAATEDACSQEHAMTEPRESDVSVVRNRI